MPRFLTCITMSILLATLSTHANQVHSVDRWHVVKPDQEKIDGKKLYTLFADLSTDPHKDLQGIVIPRHGKLVAESYFNGDNANTLHDIRSATKSITAILMGIAIQRRIIKSVDDSIADYLPDLSRDGKAKITIRDLVVHPSKTGHLN
jgi:CubicO group peptidase (beta-lactamase class C family)